MKKLLLTTLLLTSGLACAEGRWLLGAEGLGWASGHTGYGSDASSQTTARLAPGFLGYIGYENGPFVSQLSYLSVAPEGNSYFEYSFDPAHYRNAYQRADLRIGGQLVWSHLTLGLGIKGRAMRFEQSSQFGDWTSALGIDAAGMGAGLHLHLELWGGLGLGATADLLGYYGKPSLSYAEDLPRFLPMAGGDAELYLRHHYEGRSFAITLRAGLRGEGYVIDQFRVDGVEVIDQLIFGGPFLGASLRF